MNKSKIYLALVAAVAIQMPTYSFAAEAESDKKLTAKEMVLAKKAADEIEVLEIVSGYSASEAEAINMKKFAETISANLSADDLGVLPDRSIAESLSRLTGVTGNSESGRTESVNVRGLGGDYTLTTLNGREIASSWGSRSVNLSLFPGEVIRRAQVFKTSMSDSLEGGIGGAINMETIRPLGLSEDIRSISAQISSNSNFDEINIGQDKGKRLSGLFTDQLTENFAYAVGAAYSEEPVLLESYKQNGFQPWINFDKENHPDELGPGSFQFRTRHDDITRKSLFATAQWQANDDLLITADLLASDYSYEQIQANTNFILWNDFQSDPSSIIYEDSGNRDNEPNVVAASGSISGITNAPVRANGDDETQVYGLNFAYSISDDLQLDIDISGSKSDRVYAWSGAWDNFAHGMRTHISWDNTGDTPDFTYHGTDVNGDGNLVNILGDGQYHNFTEVGTTYGNTISENKAIKADLTYDVDFGMFHQIKVGARFSRNEKEQIDNWQGVTLDMMPGVDHTDYQQNITDNPLSTFSGVNGVEQYFFSIKDMFADYKDQIPAAEQGAFDHAGSYDLTEDTTALYVQASFANDWMDGTFGVRYYNTELESSGSSVDLRIKKLGWQNQDKDVYKMYLADGETVTPVTSANEYDDILPTLNVNFRLVEDTVIRLGLGKAMIRPSINKLNNAVNIKRQLASGNKTFGGAWDAEDGDSSLGNIGNSELMPITSKQADISFEYYPNNTDFYALAFFYKDLDGLYNNQPKHIAVEGAEDQDGNPVSLPLDQEAKLEGGSVSGTEFSFRTNLGFIAPDFLSGVNISGNWMKFDENATQDYNTAGANPWDANDDRYTETLYRPAGWIDETWNATLTWDITKDLSFRYNINQQSEMAIGDYREYRVRLPSKMHSASLRWGRWDDLIIHASVNNITDEYTKDGQIHSKFNDTPQLDMYHEVQYQGISYYLGASYRF
jgi:TonB-dependent receptor